MGKTILKIALKGLVLACASLTCFVLGRGIGETFEVLDREVDKGPEMVHVEGKVE